MADLRALNAFVGRPHSPNHDCADLAMDVARALFGRQLQLPTARPRPQGSRSQAAALARAMGELARPVQTPRDGDLVLMRRIGEAPGGHIGTWFFVDHQAQVLHTSVALGYSALHKISALPMLGLRIEGYYRWID